MTHNIIIGLLAILLAAIAAHSDLNQGKPK